jgi:exonuclease SbcC
MLRQKLDMLLETHAEQKSHAGCPLCGTPLSAEALQRVKDSFEADIHARRADYDRTRKELEATNKEFVAISTRIDKEREQLKHLPVAHERKAHYSQQITQMDRDQESLDTARAELAGVKQRLSEQAYAQEERKHLAEVEVEIALLVGVRDQFSAAVARRDELQAEKYDERYSELRNADNRLSNLHDDLAIDSSSVAAWRHEQETDRAEKYRLLPEVDKLGEVEGLVYDKRHEENELANLVQDLLGERGQLVGRIAHCDRLRDEKQQLTQEFKTAEDEKRIYDELVSAFGKKGIQAMIIENVIPEIEEEANSLLFRMTDGRMTVQFATQRDAKSTKSVIETLDINISDEMGTRSYEMYSGGEAYRVNFAVRIALSKLLARRAGAQLQMLVIDEGFGTQDGQGREKLVSAIRSIQEDFEKILVVTHIEELKGEFPVRIDVEKRDTGSRITVN